MSSVSFNQNTQEPAVRKPPYSGSKTTPARIDSVGRILGNGKGVPSGTQNPNGTFTGAWRSIFNVPWPTANVNVPSKEVTVPKLGSPVDEPSKI